MIETIFMYFRLWHIFNAFDATLFIRKVFLVYTPLVIYKFNLHDASNGSLEVSINEEQVFFHSVTIPK